MANEEKLKIVLEAVRDKYNSLANGDDVLDSKAGILMGFDIALGIGYLSLVAGSLSGFKFWEGIIGLIMLGFSTGFLVFITWPKGYYLNISTKFIEEEKYLKKTDEDLLLKLIDNTQKALSKNRQKSRLKSKLYKAAVVLLLGASALFILSKLPYFHV